MKLLLFLMNILFSGNVVLSEDVDTAWNDFKANFNKEYGSPEEENYRKTIFTENFNFVLSVNDLYDRGLETYRTEVNEFTDKTTEEMTGGNKEDFAEENRMVVHNFVPTGRAIPDQMDWRAKGAVTPIKNQRSCGGCWAFGTIGSLESHYFIKTGNLVSLSEQNLMDCSYKQGNKGCSGGTVDRGFTYVHENGGINSDKTYPYENADGECRYKASENITSLKTFKKIKSGNEEDLKAAVATVGPVSCYISVNSGFRQYQTEILQDRKCRYTNYLNHVVTVIGYGTENGKDYWLIKNSWGTKWGNYGFGKMIRNKYNHCDIATKCVFPVMY